jgi:hypothetical protein
MCPKSYIAEVTYIFKFLLELCSVDCHGARFAVSVKHENLTTSHLGQVNRKVEGSNDSMIAVGDCVLDVIGRGVDEDAGIIPNSGFDSCVFVDGTE